MVGIWYIVFWKIKVFLKAFLIFSTTISDFGVLHSIPTKASNLISNLLLAFTFTILDLPLLFDPPLWVLYLIWHSTCSPSLYMEEYFSMWKSNCGFLYSSPSPELGSRGQVVKVSPYKARNHLLLPGLAVYASPENLEKYSIIIDDASQEDQPSSPFAISVWNKKLYKFSFSWIHCW